MRWEANPTKKGGNLVGGSEKFQGKKKNMEKAASKG
jgi:hypothetical protein